MPPIKISDRAAPTQSMLKSIKLRQLWTLLKECKSKDISTLCLGHKLEDHLFSILKCTTAGKNLYQVYGYPVSERFHFLNQNIQLIRPLLPFSWVDLHFDVV